MDQHDSLFSQRWFNGRTNFRLSQEPIRTEDYDVEPIEYGTAKAFVVRHHYSGSFSPCIQSFGLFQRGGLSKPKLAGVATFAPASNPASVTKWSGLPFAAGAELARFVLLDDVAGNGESWFLVRALAGLKRLKPGIQVVLSYSDPVPRTRHDGSVLFPGHVGGIYAATNALYLGRASPKTQFLNADGKVIANRILSKLRNGEQGRRYAEKVLTEIAGLVRQPGETPSDFVDRALVALRPQRHPGNHLYAFAVAADRREKRRVLCLPALRRHADTAGAVPKRPDILAA